MFPQNMYKNCHSPIAPYSLLDPELLQRIISPINKLASLVLKLRHRLFQLTASPRHVLHVDRLRQTLDLFINLADLFGITLDGVVDVAPVAIDAETRFMAYRVPSRGEAASATFTVRVGAGLARRLNTMLVMAASRVFDTRAEAHDGDSVGKYGCENGEAVTEEMMAER